MSVRTTPRRRDWHGLTSKNNFHVSGNTKEYSHLKKTEVARGIALNFDGVKQDDGRQGLESILAVLLANVL